MPLCGEGGEKRLAVIISIVDDILHILEKKGVLGADERSDSKFRIKRNGERLNNIWGKSTETAFGSSSLFFPKANRRIFPKER